MLNTKNHNAKAKVVFEKYRKDSLEKLIPAYCVAHWFYGVEPKYTEEMSHVVTEEEFNEIKERAKNQKASIELF